LSLPSAVEVVNEFLYGSPSTPSSLNTSFLPNRTSDRTIDIDTAA